MPSTAIADLKGDAVVKIVGRVRLLERALDAPLTGTRCACFSLAIFDIGSDSGGLVVEECDGVPFDVEDATGSIRVTPLPFRIVSGRDTAVVRRLPEIAPGPGFLPYLESRADRPSSGHQAALALAQRRFPLRVRELAIKEGVTVALIGRVSYPGGKNDMGAATLTCPDAGELVVSADDGKQ